MEADELCCPSEAVVKAETTIVACGRYRPVRIQDFLRFERPLMRCTSMAGFRHQTCIRQVRRRKLAISLA